MSYAVPFEGKGHCRRRRGLKPRLPLLLRCAVPVEEKGKDQAILTYGGQTSRAPCSSRVPALEPRRRGLKPRLQLMLRCAIPVEGKGAEDNYILLWFKEHFEVSHGQGILAQAVEEHFDEWCVKEQLKPRNVHRGISTWQRYPMTFPKLLLMKSPSRGNRTGAVSNRAY